MSLEHQLAIERDRINNLDGAYTNLLERVSGLDNNNTTLRSWLKINRLNNDYQAILNKIGIKVNFALNGIKRSTGLGFTPDGRLAVADYYGQLKFLTHNYNVDSVFPVPYQSPTSSNEGIAYSFGFDINSDGKVAIASWARHCVRVYDASGSLLFTIGSPGSRGDVADGKIWNPRRATWLPNGNLAVCSYYGKGQNGTGHGHISEYSAADGSFIATRLSYNGNGQSAIASNICYRPIDFKLDKNSQNIAWISEYGRGKILRVNLDSWLIEDIIYAPTGMSFGNPWGICHTSGNQVCVASLAQQSIMVIDVESKELVREIKPNSLGTGFDIRDVEEVEPGYLAYSEWGSGSIAVASIEGVIEVSFEDIVLPEGSSIALDLMPENFDPPTSKLTLEIDCFQKVPEVLCVPYEKQV